MKTEKEIQDKLEFTEELCILESKYQKGRYDALEWVLQGTSSTEINQEYKIKWQKLKDEVKRQLYLSYSLADTNDYGKIIAYATIRDFMKILDWDCQLIDENQSTVIKETEKTLVEKELEAEVEVFINLHDAFINVNNSLIRHGHTDIFKEYLFDDAISALTKAVAVKENKLKEWRNEK